MKSRAYLTRACHACNASHTIWTGALHLHCMSKSRCNDHCSPNHLYGGASQNVVSCRAYSDDFVRRLCRLRCLFSMVFLLSAICTWSIVRAAALTGSSGTREPPLQSLSIATPKSHWQTLRHCLTLFNPALYFNKRQNPPAEVHPLGVRLHAGLGLQSSTAICRLLVAQHCFGRLTCGSRAHSIRVEQE
jgi:hypothetical protein